MAFLRRHTHLFFLSLGFLTRLAPARHATDKDMAASCLYYPLVGVVLGILLLLPVMALGSPWVQAWGYLALSIWLTRSLHQDGLADLLDALGSGKTGERFQAVLKDSRIGAFGVVGLFVFLSGQLVCVASCLEKGLLAPLLFAPVFARCLPVLLAIVAQPSPSVGLGKLLSNAPLPQACLLAITILICGGILLLPFASFVVSLIMAMALLCFFTVKAGKHGGYNGDYLGALILCGELAVLFSVA